MKTTAKVMLNSKLESGVGEHRQIQASFSANYADGRNKEWAVYTPSLQLTISLKGELGDRFEIGREYTLTFESD
jgi:hypothetical protein